MTTLFGILNKDDEPIDSHWLDLMAAKTQLPNCQPTRRWIDGHFGFGITQRYETPQDHLTIQPLEDSTNGIHIIATGRLDYRDDLARKLGFDIARLNTTADVVLMQLAWRKWHRDCALHLEGDWSMAVWDSRSQSLHLLRDSVGITALHYVDNDKLFAFSTRIDALLEVPGVSRAVNVERLIEVLAVCQGDGSTTAYCDIKRLKPASYISVTEGKLSKVEAYRDPLEAYDATSNSDDLFEQFVSIFEKAVEVRMRSAGPVGLTLSSGFDSSAVAVAANRIAQRAGNRLAAYAATPIDPHFEIEGRMANEAPIILNSCRNLSQIDLRFSDTSDVTPVQGMLEAIVASGEPTHAVANHFWIVSLFRQARVAGLSTLLTGQLGNATISWQGTDRRAWNDIVAGSFQAAWWRWQRQQRHHTFWQTLKSELISPILNRFRKLFLPSYLAHKWIANSFLSSSIDSVKKVKSRLISQRSQVLTDPRSFIIKGTCSQSNPFWAAMGAWEGVSVRDPTADQRLIQFCLSLPDDQFQNARESRLLAGKYLRNAGLEQVVNSRLKGLQAADIVKRLQLDGSATSAVMDRVTTAGVTILDLTKLTQKWREIQIASKTTLSDHLHSTAWMRAVSVGYFLAIMP